MLRFQSLSQTKSRGLTLIEVIVASTLVTLVIVLALSYYSASSKIFNHTKSSFDTTQSVKEAIYRLEQDLRNADSDSIENGNGETSFSFTIKNAENTISYTLIGNNLQRIEGQSTVIVAQNIVEFTYNKNGSLIDINIRSDNGDTEYAATTTIKMRN